MLQQGGAIAIKVDAEAPQFLIVTARDDPDRWVFPKSEMMGGEAPEDAAIRELLECGVQGELSACVGTTTFSAGDHDVEVAYFLIRAVAEEASTTGRGLKWLGYDEARAQLTFDDARELLDKTAGALSAR